MSLRGIVLSLVLLAGPAGAADELTQAQALIEERRFAEAQVMLETLHTERPEDTEVLRQLGRLAVKRQDREAAVDYFKQAVELAPGNASLHFEYAKACGFHAETLGTTLKALRHARQASKSLQRAIELAPDVMLYREGFVDFALEAPSIAGGGLRRARAQAAAMVDYNPVRGALNRARVEMADDEVELARTILTEALAAHPENPKLAAALAALPETPTEP